MVFTQYTKNWHGNGGGVKARRRNDQSPDRGRKEQTWEEFLMDDPSGDRRGRKVNQGQAAGPVMGNNKNLGSLTLRQPPKEPTERRSRPEPPGLSSTLKPVSTPRKPRVSPEAAFNGDETERRRAKHLGAYQRNAPPPGRFSGVAEPYLMVRNDKDYASDEPPIPLPVSKGAQDDFPPPPRVRNPLRQRTLAADPYGCYGSRYQ